MNEHHPAFGDSYLEAPVAFEFQLFQHIREVRE